MNDENILVLIVKILSVLFIFKYYIRFILPFSFYKLQYIILFMEQY